MSSLAVFNGSLALFNNQYINPPRFDPVTSRPTKLRYTIYNNSNNLRLAKQKKSPRKRSKIPAIRAFWQWVESKENENEKYIYLREIPEFISVANFTRFRNNGKDVEELQTAVVSYRKKLPWSIFQPQFQVDLVAAVHIADKEYFAALQKELANYDRVLYEMVVDKNPRRSNRNPRRRWMPPKRLPGARNQKFSIVGSIQRLMAYVLRLDFQLECLDYRKANWYHADLDYRTFKMMQFERGENLFKLARDMTVISSKAIKKSVFEQEGLDPWKLKLLWVARFFPMPLVGMFLIESFCGSSSSPIGKSPEMKALFRLDLATAMKLFLAKQITSELTDGTTDLVKNSVIIGERNRVAMEELSAAIDDGCKKIAILYGSGHMPDMDERLRTEFDLVPTQLSWRTAWSIKDQKTGGLKQLPPFLNKIVETSGWKLNRYQTLALLILSSILAVDLWLWELFFGSIKDWIEAFLWFN